MKILVCGARDWTDRATIRAWLSRFPKGSTVIHGDNGQESNGVAWIGADKIAGEEALALGFTVRAYPADWTVGLRGGPERNQRMLDEEGHTYALSNAQKFDRCLAFSWALKRKDRADRMTGTGDMVTRCVEAGIVVTIVPPGSRP